MRFNLEVGPDRWLADVGLIGHMAGISVWRGDPRHADESQYRLQFGDAWVQKPDLEKAMDAIRVAMADILANEFDLELITLIVEDHHPRWPGRIFRLEGGQ